MLSVDLGNSVGDVIWSPYSSTIFSAVTSDGKVHVYDLYENKQDPLCIQKVVKRAKLTKAKFNSSDYVLIVGDDRGGVNSLNLSPNLRKLHLESLVDAENADEENNNENSNGNGDETDEKVVDVAKVQREKMEKLRMILDGKSMTV